MPLVEAKIAAAIDVLKNNTCVDLLWNPDSWRDFLTVFKVDGKYFVTDGEMLDPYLSTKKDIIESFISSYADNCMELLFELEEPNEEAAKEIIEGSYEIDTSSYGWNKDAPGNDGWERLRDALKAEGIAWDPVVWDLNPEYYGE